MLMTTKTLMMMMMRMMDDDDDDDDNDGDDDVDDDDDNDNDDDDEDDDDTHSLITHCFVISRQNVHPRPTTTSLFHSSRTGSCYYMMHNPFTPKLKRTFSQPSKDKCISEVVRIASIIIFHLSKL